MFEYLNYSTIYQASGDLVFENKDLEGEACFSYIFTNVKNNKILTNYACFCQKDMLYKLVLNLLLTF